MKTKFALLFTVSFISLFFLITTASGQTRNPAAPKGEPKSLFQIHLLKPGKEIKFLMYEKNFLPVRGIISDDRQSIILPDYEKGMSIRVNVVYEDDTSEEFVRTPCFIDPVLEKIL